MGNGICGFQTWSRARFQLCNWRSFPTEDASAAKGIRKPAFLGDKLPGHWWSLCFALQQRRAWSVEPPERGGVPPRALGLAFCTARLGDADRFVKNATRHEVDAVPVLAPVRER